MRLLAVLSCLTACAPGPMAGADAGLDAAPLAPNPYGFVTRVPMQVDIMGDIGLPQAEQIDHVCTLHADGVDAVLYFQWDPAPYMLDTFNYSGETRVWMFDRANGATTALERASYEYGGPHRNDHIDVTVGGMLYRFNHSSYTNAYRPCAPPDCWQRLATTNHAVLDDGCTAERTHPEVCVRVTDGSIRELVATFTPCTTDTSP